MGSPALPLCSWRSEEIMYCQTPGKAATVGPLILARKKNMLCTL